MTAASRVAEARRAALLEFEQMRVELQGEATKARLALEVQVNALHLGPTWQSQGSRGYAFNFCIYPRLTNQFISASENMQRHVSSQKL